MKNPRPPQNSSGAFPPDGGRAADITEKRTIGALCRSESRFRAFVAAGSDVIYHMSPGWDEMYCLHGWDFIPDTCSPDSTWVGRYVHPDDQPQMLEMISETIRTKSVFELEHRVQRADGTLGWMFSRAIPVVDAAGEITEWFGAATDITARKRAEENITFLGEVSQILANPTSIAETMATLGGRICEHFNATRCAFGEVDEGQGFVTVNYEWRPAAAPGFKGRRRIHDYLKEESRRAFFAGESLVVRDACQDARLNGAGGAASRADAFISVPLLRDGRFCFSLNIIDTKPRDWRADEIELARELAERVWVDLERRRAEVALRESEARYRAIFENAGEGIVYSDTEGVCLHCNQRFADMLGYEMGEVVGKTSEDFCFPAERSQLQNIRKNLKQGKSQRGELRYRSKAGGEIWIMFNTAPIFNDAGEHIANFAMHTDVTARIKAEGALKEAVRMGEVRCHRLNAIMETVPDGLIIYDANGNITFINECARKLSAIMKPIGGSMEDKVCEMFTAAGQRLALENEPCYRALFGGETVKDMEMYCRTVTGGTMWLSVSCTPVQDIGGRITGAVVSCKDITKFKQAEEILRRDQRHLEKLVQEGARELKQFEDKFCKIFHNSPDMMFIFGMADDRFAEINQRFVDILGYSRAEVIGRTPEDLKILADDEARAGLLYGELLKQGRLVNHELNLCAKSGRIVRTLCSAEVININGADYLLTMAKDVTREKKIEAELARLDRLHLVGEMAAGIGHEIRNPMTTVRGFLQLMGEKDDLAAYKGYLTMMIEELDRANAIITEFLSLAKNKAMDFRARSLNTLINNIFPLLQADGLVTDKYIELDLRNTPDLRLDEKEIRQLIHNLARNGIEASPPGGTVVISTYVEGKEAVLAVKDRGCGIPDEIAEKIGTPFFTTKDTGTGLGLAVCYSIVERHNAHMDFTTSPGGTTFFVRFRLG